MVCSASLCIDVVCSALICMDIPNVFIWVLDVLDTSPSVIRMQNPNVLPYSTAANGRIYGNAIELGSLNSIYLLDSSTSIYDEYIFISKQ